MAKGKSQGERERERVWGVGFAGKGSLFIAIMGVDPTF